MIGRNNTPSAAPKALPPLSKDDDLPPPPTPIRDAAPSAPSPPPKITLDKLPDIPIESVTFKDSLLSAPPSPLRDALSPPGIATPPDSPSFSPGSSTLLGPPSPTADISHPKKVNPFVDLLETEKIYVDTLSGIIRKVASAWSRSNLPPPELDSMFRAVEAVFKANRFFLSKLKEIGPNPSSARVIGDLLIKWIDHLDTSYNNYCSQYLVGFDTWEPIRSNSRLPGVLQAFSSTNPPPTTGPPVWTLDALFALPRSRIKYYQKLYGRLLKNSAPGRNTERPLVDAVGKLEKFMALLDERSTVALSGSDQVIETTDEVVVDTRENSQSIRAQAVEKVEKKETANGRAGSEETVRGSEERNARTSGESSMRGSSLSSGQRSSRDTVPTSDGRSSISTLSTSMADLERRLATDRCRDLFTMNPRSVRLSINSPNLPYTRELRLSEDGVIHFTPKSTSVGIIHRLGHIFLLTDLFLVCERMTPEDRAHCESETADMWLCYPPLAAKHLRVAGLEDNGLEITILKKEVMTIRLDSASKRDYMLKEFHSTTSLAAALPPPSKQPPPPLPILNGFPKPPQDTPSLGRRPSETINGTLSQPQSASNSPRANSPLPGDPSMHRIDPHRTLSGELSPPSSQNASRAPSIRELGPPGPPPYSPSIDSVTGIPPRSGTSPAPPQTSTPPSFGPGQVIPPPRGDSSRPPQPPGSSILGPGPNQPGPNGMMGLPPRPNMRDGPPSFSPGQIVPPPRGESVRSPPPINVMNGMPPREIVRSPPPMNGMNNIDRPQGPINGPPRNGSMGPPRPPMGGPGQGPGQVPFFPGPMHSIPGHPPPAPQGPLPTPMPPQIPQQHIPPQPTPQAHIARTPSDPSYLGGVRKSPSTRSLGSQYDRQQPLSAPPVPNLPGGFPPQRPNGLPPPRLDPSGQLRPMLPSAALPRIVSAAPEFVTEPSPPPSPTEEIPKGPVESSVLATMKCKVFLKQHHAQWKSLGTAKLTLYEQRPTMIKQLVVEADSKSRTLLISTIVLTDGVERVGKTGVAIELSDQGSRTGIVYMLQLRNETSAGGLFETLLAGSDRSGK